MHGKDDGKKTKNEYVKWLVRYDWQWFCTLTIRPGIRPSALAQLFEEWINSVRRDEGKKISWIRMIERRGLEGRLHIHALIAGTRLFAPESSADSWYEMAGNAQIGPYDADSECLRYTLKDIETNPDFDFDCELSPKHLLSPAKLRRIEDDMEWLQDA